MTQDIPQGTQEWHAARCGRVTASRIADVMAKTKTGPSASRVNYMAELVAERLTGVPASSFSNAAMQWGTDHEPAARECYVFETGASVVEVGFFIHPVLLMAGASPDGLVGDDGLVEIKCPNTATHIDTLKGAPIADKYMKQMQFQMACTGRQWCDFVSYDPRMPIEMQLRIRRIDRDAEAIAEIEASVRAFIEEIDATVADLLGQYRKAA